MSDEQTFDYKKILKAYINHVGNEEGITFLEARHVKKIEGLTETETQELLRVEAEK